MIGERPIHGRAPTKRGAVWPRGSELRDMLASPGLVSQDGSIQIVSGPTGTDLSLPDCPGVTAVYDAATGIWTCHVRVPWVRVSDFRSELTVATATWTFRETGDADYPWLAVYAMPHYSVPRLTTAGYGVLMHEADGLEAADAETADAGTIDEFWHPSACAGMLLVYSAAHSAVWYSNSAALGFPERRIRGDPIRVGSALPLRFRYIWNRDAGTGTFEAVGSMINDLTIPPSTEDSISLYASSTNPWCWDRLCLGGIPAGASGRWAFSIRTGSRGELVELSAQDPLLWHYVPPVGFSMGWSGSFRDNDGHVITVRNGLIVDRT